LDLLKRLGITSVAELTSRLGIVEPAPEPPAGPPSQPEANPAPAQPAGDDVYGNAADLYGDDMPDIPPGTPDPEGGDSTGTGGTNSGGQVRSGTDGATSGGGHGPNGGGHRGGSSGGTGSTTPGKRTPGSAGGRPFISYVGTHPDEEDPDPDGLDQATRMRIEANAIEKIIELEPTLIRTPEGNPGYDLYENDGSGQPVRWVEVKSMTGALSDRPIGLSHTQFDCARARDCAYWLYIVEHATDPVHM
ncbi:MAG: protein NO VEIN domain-containing protein, partial [Burkholderiales bacterium]